MEKELADLQEKGIELCKGQQYDQAIKCFDQILKTDTDNAQALYGKSLVFAKNGKARDAYGIVEHLIKLSDSPSDPMIDHKNFVIARCLAEDHSLEFGKSYDTAIEIRAKTTPEGIKKEKCFICNVHGEYTFIQQTLQSQEPHGLFDILRIKTKQGQELDYYFDINSFFGKGFGEL